MELAYLQSSQSLRLYSYGASRNRKITSQPTSDRFKNLHEFLDHVFGGRTLEFHVKNLTKPGDGAISDLRALDVKLRKSNHSNEVIRHGYSMIENLMRIKHVFFTGDGNAAFSIQDNVTRSRYCSAGIGFYERISFLHRDYSGHRAISSDGKCARK